MKKRPKLPITVKNYFLDHYFGSGSHPYFGVWEIKGSEFELICATVYRKGAEEVMRRLTEQVSKEGKEGLLK